MLNNHLRLAWRSLIKRKGYSALNTLGLAIGITCCLLIFQYVAFERSYDSFQQNAGRIVRLRLDAWQKGKLAWQSATVYPAIAPAMKKDFPEVENYCRLIDANFLLANDRNQNKIRETKGYFADPAALDMLGVHLTEGNPATALDGPYKIVLSEATAKKYFGQEDPLGKKLTVKDGNRISLEVTGVFREYPANSHLILHHLISYTTLDAEIAKGGDSTRPAETAWGWYDFYAYVQLKPGADWHQLQAKMPAFCDRYINNQDWSKKNNVRDELFLIPLTDIHLYSNYNQEAEVNGNGKSVGFLFLISFFIIVIAWVNYTNLATARSLERAKEVGVRKVLGAARRDLVLQFLSESFLLNILALVIALGAAVLLTRPFNTLIGSEGSSFFSMPAAYSLLFLGLFLTGTLLSGLYPAFVLSGYHPIIVLKGLFKNTSKGLILRKGLIIGQFTVSVILITGTILVYQQVQYMRRQQLGVNINQTLVLQAATSQQDSIYKNVFQPFKATLLQQPAIKSVTASSNVMGQEIYWTSGFSRVGENAKSAVTLYRLGVDYDFLPAYDLQPVAGRNFSRNFSTDDKAVLVNEKAAELLGFKNAADAINGKLRTRDTLHIIGVVPNFHQEGLQKAVNPMLIQLVPTIRSYYSVKISTNQVQQTIAGIEKTWNRYFPEDPFNYFFLDESFNEQYKADTRFGEVFGLFAGLAILIACFGLLGLSAYNVLQRTKEIGIRKVLGATERSLVFLLSREFLYLVLLSLVIAIPVTWLVMHNWLQDFAYRISIEWWVFLLGGVLALLIALATVGFQALRAAAANPVKSLRTE